MLKQYVNDYAAVEEIGEFKGIASGASVSPKEIIFHILKDNTESTEVLDIGFGDGSLGELVKSNINTKHWSVDGIDGWEANCRNKHLFDRSVYRNVWYGLAQELSHERLSQYKIICLLDVIEHLSIDTAKFLLRTLLTSLGEDSYLFVSTPLWFYPQNSQQLGDLEEHLIGVPASSLLSLCPVMYAVNHPLVGGFVFSKRSLDFVDFFQPSADKSFSYDKGMKIARAVGLRVEPNVLFKLE
jgi:2-polyprenyl-3-methyl-5-hydroxy-6-metoxy-1,4-benzoquinol methylase